MMELNNSNALIRIYSRMVSCSFMILACTALPLFQSLDTALVTLCFITFLLAAFNSYQDKQAVGWVFYAFLALSIASTIFPQVLFFIPFIWLFMAYLLMTFSVRTFGASLIGLLTPYSFILPVCVLTDHMDFFDNLYCQFTDFRPLLFMHSQQESLLTAIGDRVNVVLLFSFIFVTICAIIGTVHFLRNSGIDLIHHDAAACRLLHRNKDRCTEIVKSAQIRRNTEAVKQFCDLDFGIGVRHICICRRDAADPVDLLHERGGTVRKTDTADVLLFEQPFQIGILFAADSLARPVHFYDHAQLQAMIARYQLEESDFVKENIGIGNVCEAAAYCCVGEAGGRLALRKTKFEKVTVALVWEK